MERPYRARHGPRRGVRLEWRRLPQPFAGGQGDHRHELERAPLLRAERRQERHLEEKRNRRANIEPSVRNGRIAPATRSSQPGGPTMKQGERKIVLRCAVYTRVSTDSGLEQDFNSLDNQREAPEAYIKSQAHEGWKLVRERYDDGGFSGGSMERPALQELLDDVRARKIDVIVVYKVDRLTRSLADFAKLVELFDAHAVSFISVTQAFNTTTSMGRLTLNMLLSFAQFEREITGERIRDKVDASKRKGIWMGGAVPLGYRVEDRALRVVERRLSSSAPSIAATSKLAAWCASRLLSAPRTFTPPPG